MPLYGGAFIDYGLLIVGAALRVKEVLDWLMLLALSEMGELPLLARKCIAMATYI